MSKETFVFVDAMMHIMAEENNTKVLKKKKAYEVYLQAMKGNKR